MYLQSVVCTGGGGCICGWWRSSQVYKLQILRSSRKLLVDKAAWGSEEPGAECFQCIFENKIKK